MCVPIGKGWIHGDKVIVFPALERVEIIMNDMQVYPAQLLLFPFQPSVFRSFDRIELAVIPYLAVVLFLFVELSNPLGQLAHPLSAELILKNGAEIGINLHTVNIQLPLTVTP